jgi:tetratricopeptide (TPR) repeat protein
MLISNRYILDFGQRVLILIVSVVLLLCFSSCSSWHEAERVIAMADSIDQTEHVIYSDTAVLGKTIRTLDNPFGRLFKSNTLGKAYYYMGRNYSLSNQIADAANCYIEADRLQIDDPIFRGRVNSNMAYICAQNNNDSLALIFYERASNDFKESGNEWRYSQTLLDRSESNILLHYYLVADSLLQIAQSYQFDSAYQARYYETCGLYFYEQQQYDSALVYFHKGLNYWQSEEEKCFSYLKIMQSYWGNISIDSTMHYAHKLILISNNPNYISNAYYCLMQVAKNKNDVELLSQYSHARTDAQKLLRDNTNQYAAAIPKLIEYLQNPHPLRWVWIMLATILLVCIILFVGAVVYRQRNRIAYEQIDKLSTYVENQEALLSQELYYRQFGEKLSNIVDRYHAPHKRWKEYKTLKRDLSPWLHTWMCKLDTLPLSEREKIFCTISLVYSHMTDIEIAEYLCYDKHGIRVFKQRIAKKIGTTSADLLDFLRNLPVNE